jgi:hypothetical protein
MSKYNQGIDSKYRPRSYFLARELGIPLISDIKGVERRKLYEGALQSGLEDQVTPELLQHALPSEQRQAQGGIHPAFMGGEYWPNNRPGEVEIACITIASTTQDVICVYACQVGKRIHYRVVGEYNGNTLERPSTRTSLKPRTLEQLLGFFLNSWNLVFCLDSNFENDGYPRDSVHEFIVDASSSFYAECDQLIHAQVDEWLDTLPQNEEEEDEK